MLAANTILDVQISTPSPVKLLRGDTLTLNCTTTTALNTRVQMTWSYPGEVSDIFSVSPVGQYLFLASEMPLSFWGGKDQNVLPPVAAWVNKEAVGLSGALSLSDIPGVCRHRYGPLMSGGFVLKCRGWYFCCMIPGGKGDCFILGKFLWDLEMRERFITRCQAGAIFCKNNNKKLLSVH